MTPTPSAFSRRTTSKSVAISDSSRIADGSSMISSRTLPDSARAIETTCCAAGRKLPDLRPHGNRLVSEPREQRFRFPVHRAQVEQRPVARLVGEEDALGDAQVGDEIELLVDRRDPALERSRRVSRRERLAQEDDLAARRLERAGDALDQRRLARAVGPEQAVNLRLEHLEVDALERLHARELLDQVANLENLGHRATSCLRLSCAMRRPSSTSSGVPPQTGSSCSTERTPSNPLSCSVST